MAKKAATPQRSAARGKGKSKGKGAPAGTSLPAGWKELFCTIADAEDLSAALALLHATFPPRDPSNPNDKGRYGNLNDKKLMHIMIPRRTDAGDRCAGGRVFWRSDRAAAIFFFVRLAKRDEEAYHMTVCSTDSTADNLYRDLPSIVAYVRAHGPIQQIEIVNEKALPNDLSDSQSPALASLFNKAKADGWFVVLGQSIALNSAAWPASLLRWVVK